MAWVKHWVVPFGDLSGETQYQVGLYEWGFTGSVVTLTGAGVPFVTMESDDEHVFRAVRGQTGYLSVVADDGTLLESLMPKTNTEKLVRLESGIYDGTDWVTGSVLGSLLGTVLPFSTEGIEFSMTALFIASFTGQWMSTGDHIPALTGR